MGGSRAHRASNIATTPRSPRFRLPGRPRRIEHQHPVKQVLELHLAYPLPYPLAGAYFEEIFAYTVGGTREPRKLLFDVVKGTVGWSLKTLQWQDLKPGASFEVVIQRCDILKNASLTLAATELAALGAAILSHFKTFADLSAQVQVVDDPRAGFLIRDLENNFVFFQSAYRAHPEEELTWEWGSERRNSLVGRLGSKIVLRWYRSGTQLFGVYTIPDDAHVFHIDCERASMTDTLEFLEERGLTHVADATLSDL
jgi:hypothetical protein